MKILVAFPDVPYYNWQVLVQINNFVKFGFSNEMIYVVVKQPGQQLSKQIKDVLDNTPVEYYVYDDDRERKNYPSSLRLHGLRKLFKEKPEYSGETFFYVDPDLIFSKAVSFTTLLNNDTWYVSDTKSYVDSKYIKSKSEKLFTDMCEIVGLEPSLVEENDDNAGGAQYLMKNIGEKYWLKAERNSETLFEWLKHTESIYNPEHPIQSWTSDMWAVLWSGWYFEHDIKIASRLSFSWATDPIGNWDQHNLFHNAGAIDQTNLFKKTDYQTSPFNADFSHVSDQFCSYKYMEEVEETKINYPELIKLF